MGPVLPGLTMGKPLESQECGHVVLAVYSGRFLSPQHCLHHLGNILGRHQWWGAWGLVANASS